MRNVSDAFQGAVFRSQTDEVFIVLLTIDHENLAEPIRVTSDAVNTISNGDTFIPYPFAVQLPSEQNDSVPIAKLSIDNVHRLIGQTIREIDTPPEVTVQIVLHSDPDLVEAEWTGLIIEKVSYNALTVEADIVGPDILNEPFPGDKFTPDKFPGLF